MSARPYRLVLTDSGILGETWGTFSAPENAWKKADELEAFWQEKRWIHLYSGQWFIVTGPDGFYEWWQIKPADDPEQKAPPFFSRGTPRPTKEVVR